MQDILDRKNNTHPLLMSQFSQRSEDDIDIDKYKEPPPKPELRKRQ